MQTQTEIMVGAAKAGGAILIRYFGQSLDTMQKSTASDFRTKADLESEAAILQILRKEFPGYNIHSEEEGKKDNHSEYSLIIDPLDGTNNFVLGIPNFSVSIGLLRGDEIIAGVIYLPFMNHTYWAEKGAGAFLDDKKVKVNAESEVSRSTVSIVCGYTDLYDFNSTIIKRLNDENLKRCLTNWSPAYDFCLLAAGKIEAIINNNSEIYDYAAGKLIASEAGAVMTDFKGNPVSDKDSIFVASNGSTLHKKLLENLSV